MAKLPPQARLCLAFDLRHVLLLPLALRAAGLAWRCRRLHFFFGILLLRLFTVIATIIILGVVVFASIVVSLIALPIVVASILPSCRGERLDSFAMRPPAAIAPSIVAQR